MCGSNTRFLMFLLFVSLLVFMAGALRGQDLPQPGKMPPLLPANAQQSSSSEEHLETWNRLSQKFGETLNQHEAALNELYARLQTSEASGQKLTSLLGELSRQNADLKNYNQQIGERMQERDEDLAQAYDSLDEAEKRFLKAAVVIVVLGAVIAGAIALKVCRLLKIAPI